MPRSTNRVDTSYKGVSVQHGHGRASSGSTSIDSSSQSSISLTTSPKCSVSKIEPPTGQTLKNSAVQPESLSLSKLENLECANPKQYDNEHTEFFAHLPFDTVGLGDTEQLKDQNYSANRPKKLDTDTASVDELMSLLKQNQEKYESNIAHIKKHYCEKLQSSHADSGSKHHHVVTELWRALKINDKSRQTANYRANEFEDKNGCLRGELRAKEFQLRQTTSLAQNYRTAYGTILRVNTEHTSRITALDSLLREKSGELRNAEAKIVNLNRAIEQDRTLVNYMEELLRSLHASLNHFQKDSMGKSDALQGLAMLLKQNPSDLPGMRRNLEERLQKISDLEKQIKIDARELRCAKMQHTIDQEDADRKVEYLKNELERKETALQKAVSIKNTYKTANEGAMNKLRQHLTDDDIVDTISASHQLVLEDNISLSDQIGQQERDLSLAKAQLAPFIAENCSLKSKNNLLLQDKAAADDCIVEIRRELKEGFKKHQRIVTAKDHEIKQRDLAIKDASDQADTYLAENATGREHLDRIANDTYTAYLKIELARVSETIPYLWAELTEFQRKEIERDEEDKAKERADKMQEEQHSKRVEDLQLEVENLRELLDVKNGQGDFTEKLNSMDNLRARDKRSIELNEGLALLAKQFLTRIYALEARLPSSTVEAIGVERTVLMNFCQRVFESNDLPFFTAEEVQGNEEEEVLNDEKVKEVFEDDAVSAAEDKNDILTAQDEDDVCTAEDQDDLGALAAYCQGYHNEPLAQQDNRAPGLYNIYDDEGNIVDLEYVKAPEYPQNVKEGEQKEKDEESFKVTSDEDCMAKLFSKGPTA